jgi:predicted peptidase
MRSRTYCSGCFLSPNDWARKTFNWKGWFSGLSREQKERGLTGTPSGVADFILRVLPTRSLIDRPAFLGRIKTMFKVACMCRGTHLAIFGLAVLILSSRGLAQTVDDFEDRHYTDGSHTLPYRLFVPRDYDPAQAYPLVLFLHPSGLNGTDNRLQIGSTFLLNNPALVFVKPENQQVWPCFMMAPQCPVGHDWGFSAVPSTWLKLTIEVIDALQQEFRIDPGRLYVTGYSIGGFGTWSAIMAYPGKFAAAVPVAGGGDVHSADRCAQTPMWNFHSDDDPTVSVENSRAMIAAVRAAGGNPIYTEYTGYGHNTWGPAYAEPDLLLWLFAQSH